MMKRKISPRDIELLSAYLDRQLDGGQRTRLESRLRTEPELRAVYQDLRQTRTLIRSLPRLKAPRSFTLTPAMVGQKQAKEVPPRRIYPVFQFASALASILLVLVLAGDFLGSRFGIPSGAEAPAQPGIVAMEAPKAESQTPLMEDLEATEQPAAGQAGEMESRQADATSSGPGEGAATEQALPMLESAPAEPFSATLPSAITATMPLSMTASITETVLASPEAEIMAGAPAYPAGEEAIPSQVAERREVLSLWRVAEISLAVFAFSSALAAVYLRRKYGPRG